MPEPVGFEVLEALAFKPASCQSLSSALLVPESSALEANGAFASAISLNALAASLSPAILAGRRRPYDDEIVVHDAVTLNAPTVSYELFLVRFRVDQHHIAIAILGIFQRLAGPNCHDTHFDARLLREERKNVLEQS
jgi:hypothetical protein